MVEKVKEVVENIEVIERALEGLNFGELHITIHEGKVVQINRTEKLRFPVSKTEKTK